MKCKLLLILVLIGISHFSHANKIAVTFDDLPEASNADIKQQSEINQRILNTLLQFKVPATGFVNERKLYSNKTDTQAKIKLLKLWVDNGFNLGNHTWSHRSLNTLTLQQFKTEVNNGSKISKKLMHQAGKKYQYFRHPYLHTGATPAVRTGTEDFLKEKGYRIAPVTIDTDDWKFNHALLAHPENQEKIIQAYLLHTRAKFAFYEDASRKIFGRNIRHVWLLHVNLLNSLTMKQLLTIARAFDYDFISLDQALEDEAWQSPNDYYTSFGISWLYRWDFTKGKVVDWSKDPEPDNNPYVRAKAVKFYDRNRKRKIPAMLYISDDSQAKAKAGIIKLPVAIINHGYTVKNTEYTFLANALAKNGWFVVSIQHDLETDPKPVQTVNVIKRRKPLWERGSANIFHVIKTLEQTRSFLDLKQVTLIGHSNGGDIALLFASLHPEMAARIISLDSLRMPFPQSGKLPVLTIRANDTMADEHVLPPEKIQKTSAITIIQMHEAKHIDLCDRGPDVVRNRVNEIILQYLRNKT